MAVHVRRVVTGHDANGRAVVKIDEVSKNLGGEKVPGTFYFPERSSSEHS